MKGKQCRVCNKSKALGEFSLVSKATGTRRNICKSCNSTDTKKRQKKNRDRGDHADASKSKKCSKCHKTKAISEFNKDSSTNSGWREICRGCQKRTFKVWHSKKKDD